jgi:NADH-quinone oxidoreductase subunit G
VAKVTIEIDGKQIEAEAGSMIIQVADAAGIYIPRFCYHDKLSIAANCRMCLVEVEKAPKPLPACATPVADGMKVSTRSKTARDAQKGTMEFLLINHPLDCPICDQGGECELQDLAVGYGKDLSRYQEGKRIVKDRDIGPLIQTEMTRCIHCTRCVRFGQEIAGVMELGASGRGEHTRIGPFLDYTVDSELSGNVIDLCPVGALTSRPFRYQARAWELQDHTSIAPHDALGSNITIQTRGHDVMRVLPHDNSAVNECWLSDRDRFSYEGLLGSDRLLNPMIKRNGHWEAVGWDEAFEFTVDGLRRTISRYGAKNFGALVSPTATLEEFYLAQKLVRGLGSGNVDHRLRQLEFDDDAVAPLFPWFGQAIADFEKSDAVLLIGSNLRKDVPMLAHRVRKAAKAGARIMALNAVDYDFTYRLDSKLIVSTAGFAAKLSAIAKALQQKTGKPVPAAANEWLAAVSPDETETRIAESLLQGDHASILVGAQALNSVCAPAVRALAELVADLSGARLGIIPEANSVAAWLAGCVPHRGVAGGDALAGRNARQMISDPLKAYLTFGIEPELDCSDGSRARTAMHAADFVVMVSSFKPCARGTTAEQYGDVWLPLAPFTENAGTFINGEGRVQAFTEATRPQGEARPGWKILRVLGDRLGVDGFGYNRLDDIRADMGFGEIRASSKMREWRIPERSVPRSEKMIRLLEVPIYAVDPVVRRAPALQSTRDNPKPAAHLNPEEAAKLGLGHGDRVTVRMVEGAAELELVVDARLPRGCVLVPAGYAETATLGASGPATVTRAQ